MEELRKKYIDLLLNKCIYPKNKSLFISYEKENIDFITLLIQRAKQRISVSMSSKVVLESLFLDIAVNNLAP